MKKLMFFIVLSFFLSTPLEAVAFAQPTDGAQVKEGIDAEAGKLNWITVLAVIGAALLVYLLNRKKKQQVE